MAEICFLLAVACLFLLNRWTCKDCKKSYHNHLPAVVALMPKFIQSLAPFHVVGQTYINRKLVASLRDHVVNGGSFESFFKEITSAHKTKYFRAYQMYIDLWKTAHLSKSNDDGIYPVAPVFGTYGDKTGYDGDSVPSLATLLKIWHDDHDSRKEWLDRRMMMIEPGKIMKGDASFKAAAILHVNGGVKACASIFTLMNGRNEVRGTTLANAFIIIIVRSSLIAHSTIYLVIEWPPLIITYHHTSSI